MRTKCRPRPRTWLAAIEELAGTTLATRPAGISRPPSRMNSSQWDWKKPAMWCPSPRSASTGSMSPLPVPRCSCPRCSPCCRRRNPYPVSPGRSSLPRPASCRHTFVIRRKGDDRRMSNKFTRYILIAMALGVVMGALVYDYLPQDRADIASSINLIALLFLRLIKMIIAPLVFATLVGGIAHMGSGAKLGRIFAKTMGWFVCASFVSLLLGMVMVNLLQPGANFPGTLPEKGQATGLPVSAFSIEKYLP